MDCPLCKVKLHITHRQGVEIDYCPECRGIWLDRGELEKLIELSSAPARSPQPAYQQSDRYRSNDYDDRYGDSYDRKRRSKRKGSWLSELLDFD